LGVKGMGGRMAGCMRWEREGSTDSRNNQDVGGVGISKNGGGGNRAQEGRRVWVFAV
jgi:hypothetical protein